MGVCYSFMLAITSRMILGMEHGGCFAYLIGWIAPRINKKARLGIGDFVEIKDKEKKL